MKSLFKAVALITFFTIITRFLGFLFRIYLSREIGAEALGLYQVAFSVFMVLITFVASGMPLIISKISASLQAQKQKKEERAMISSALIISVITAILTCLIVLMLNKLLSSIFTDDRCVIILILLLPAVIFNAIYSTFRGYFWGHSNYFGVCIVELFEQVARILICVFMLAGAVTVMDGAVTASISLSIACFFSAVFVTILYFCYGGRLAKPKKYAKELIKTSLPITSVRLASSLIQPIIAIIVPLRLVSAGMATNEAMAIFGIAFGMTLPFLFIPSALIGSLGMALVPDLSTAVAQKDSHHIEKRITSSIVITMFISSIFIPLYMGAGENIGLFFFDNIESGKLLINSAWIMLPIGITTISSAILNALGHELKSMKNYILGAIFLLLSIWLLPKYIGVNAIIIGMGLCMTLASILNIKMINKATTSKISILKPICIMLLISIPIASLTSFTTNLLAHFTPLFINLTFSCGLGGLFFILLCDIFKIINLQEILETWKTKRKIKIQKAQNV